MSLTNEERQTLVALELKKASETFEEINILAAANKWSGAANRLYYSVFHAINALLLHGGHSVSTHNGSHALFNLFYIKTGILPLEYGRLYNQLQTMREECDYNCVYEVEPEALQERIEPARRLIEDINKIINS
ncbi:MAG: HEPN domain-containing protein [Bacteroidaceae bacterium]|nr:HEPN domain-containing protein [Bacteroidaceae bacterium]